MQSVPPYVNVSLLVFTSILKKISLIEIIKSKHCSTENVPLTDGKYNSTTPKHFEQCSLNFINYYYNASSHKGHHIILHKNFL